ncbi:TnsA endonuclease N-terminal domain-containing protein [Paenibacillus sp. Dod16]|uniref:TnsA endonuclease N-terminal domain-containing protein n=1 Tax=Paenibacillus sp. Dod16 TaxID=3416392 RepID=UPI003CF74B02
MQKPARQIRPKVKGFRGKEPFLKTGDMIHWDSFLERNFIRLADFDLSVDELYYQPLEINYQINGKKFRYYPDFKMILESNKVCIVEVKTERFFNTEKNAIKYEVGRRYCEERGWQYEVFTERQINPGFLQSNLSLLRHLGTQDVPERVEEFILNQLKKVNDNIPFFELRESCEELEDETFYAAAYRLIYLQEIQTDLINKKVTDESLLSYEGD